MDERLPIQGHLEGIVGAMFSGKTEELLRRIRRVKIAKIPIQMFKPKIDTRDGDFIVARNAGKVPCVQVEYAKDLLYLVREETKVVALDEVQFFDPQIVGVADTLANRGLRIIWSGLDLDFRGQPFGSVPNLLAISEYITKLSAICTYPGCGAAAFRSARLSEGSGLVEVGHDYEARCRLHHKPVK